MAVSKTRSDKAAKGAPIGADRPPVDGIDVSVSPLLGAGLLSRLTFHWMNRFIMVGRKTTLTEAHMPELW